MPKTSPAAETPAWPLTVEYKGRTYYRTWKDGVRIANGEAATEYEDEDDAGRVWMDATGEVYPE